MAHQCGELHDVCPADVAFTSECGSYVALTPSNVIPGRFPDAPINVTVSVASESSVEVQWIQPDSVSEIVSYRVDAFTKSAQASSLSSFFGDQEVQRITSGASNVSAGTFTIAYDNFSIRTVSAYSNLFVFNTSEDLSSYLQPGDQISVEGSTYTIASLKFSYPWQIFVNQNIKAAIANTDVVEAAVLGRPKTNPIPFDITQQKLKLLLENQPAFGQVQVERTLQGEGYSWTVTFVSNVGDQPLMVVNTLQLLGLDPTIAVQTISTGVAPSNYFSTVVEASSTVMTATIDSLTTGEAWFFRVLATNAIGDGVLSSVQSAVPAAAPLAVSSLTVKSFGASSLLVSFTQDAFSNGDDIQSYQLTMGSDAGSTAASRRKLSAASGVSKNFSVPLSNRVQKVFTSAHTLPFTAGSTFTLSVGS